MPEMIIGFIFSFALGVSFVYLIDRYKKSKERSSICKATIALINRYYYHDSGVQLHLEHYPVDEALDRGQLLLFEKAEDFNQQLANLVMSHDTEDITEKKMEEVFMTAVAIIKTASLMHFIYSSNKPFDVSSKIILIDEGQPEISKAS